MKLALVGAMAADRVIGREGELPWRLPDEMAHFRRLTTGHSVIVGRRTFESMGRALPHRRTIVVSRRGIDAPGCEVAGSLEAALARCEGEDLVFVIGGAELYRAALPRAHRLYLTEVHARVEGDVRFPEIDLSGWQLSSEEHHPADARNPHAFTIRRYDRRPT